MAFSFQLNSSSFDSQCCYFDPQLTTESHEFNFVVLISHLTTSHTLKIGEYFLFS